MVNVIVLWQTVYIQAALDHLVATGQKFDRADVARLSPLGHPTINLNGRYRTTGRAPSGGLRPLGVSVRPVSPGTRDCVEPAQLP